MSAAADAIALAARPRRAAPARATVRAVAFAALGAFAALRWARLEAPADPGAALICAAVALAALLAGQRRAGLRRRARRLGTLAAAVALPVVVLLAAGVPLRLLAPDHWGSLAAGIGQGLQALPGIAVPYRGVDPWVRTVLEASGGALLLAAALAASRAWRVGRRPLGAAVLLAVVYAVPVVEHPPARPVLDGALIALLLGALLWADRVERDQAGAAAVFAAVALGAGALAAPALDADEPWVDYRQIVASLSSPPTIVYDWDHGYGPLRWRRDGREMLRVAVSRPVYLKAATLDSFDGLRWRAARTLPPGTDTEIAADHPDWRVRLRVTVRDLRSATYFGAATTLRIDGAPRNVVGSGPGTFATGAEALRRGDSYVAEVYAPRPSADELAAAGDAYPLYALAHLWIALPPEAGGPDGASAIGVPSTFGPLRIEFADFGLDRPPAVVDRAGVARPGGAALLARSRYAGAWALARRLRARSATPYDYVRAVQRHLASGYAYTERPPPPRPGRPPLVSFLLDSRAGYCQQFSGAMALLLRMGGVPARVASGFSPGSRDGARGDWVVRDLDAHSWVEAYFPGIGWVTFDPTPAVAPARSQLANVPAAPGGSPFTPRPDARRGDVPRRPAPSDEPAQGAGNVSPWLVAALSLLGGGLLVGLAAARRRARSGVCELGELLRALRVTGRPVEPATTLHALERRLARHAPQAAAYVTALRLARFAGEPVGPSAQQRRALRRELAEGLGAVGRLRALWALPPRPGRGLH